VLAEAFCDATKAAERGRASNPDEIRRTNLQRASFYQLSIAFRVCISLHSALFPPNAACGQTLFAQYGISSILLLGCRAKAGSYLNAKSFPSTERASRWRVDLREQFA